MASKAFIPYHVIAVSCILILYAKTARLSAHRFFRLSTWIMIDWDSRGCYSNAMKLWNKEHNEETSSNQIVKKERIIELSNLNSIQNANSAEIKINI